MFGLLRKLWIRLSLVGRSYPVSGHPGTSAWTGQSSAVGTVDEDTALSLSAVFAAVNLLSRLVGSLPLAVHRRIGRFKEHALTHPAYRLLHTQPNPEMTAATFRRVMEWNRVLGHGAYAQITWAGNGKPLAFWPIPYWRVRPEWQKDDVLKFRVDGTELVEPHDMLHVPSVTWDGVRSWSFLDWAAESLGLGIAAQQHAATFFGSGARPGVILKHPNPNLTKQQRDEMRRGWDERHQGPDKGGKTAVLWGQWEYEEAGQVEPEKSQLLEQRKFTTEEVARWIGVPASLLQALASGGTLEQQGLQFVAFFLGPVLEDYEQEYNRKLLDPPQVYAKHNTGALMRGDAAARSAFYRNQWGIGALSTNEIRDYEDLNPCDGGDVHWIPLNMAPAAEYVAGTWTPPGTPPAPAPPPANPGAPAPPSSGQPAPPASAPPAKPEPMRAELADDSKGGQFKKGGGRESGDGKDDKKGGGKKKDDGGGGRGKDRERRRDEEDVGDFHRRRKESREIEKRHAAEMDEVVDRQMAEAGELEDRKAAAQGKLDKEESRVQAPRDKEDRESEAARKKEDASVAAAREKEDAEVAAAREKEDARTPPDETVLGQRQNEDEQRQLEREEEDAGRAADRAEEDDAVNARREQEDEANPRLRALRDAVGEVEDEEAEMERRHRQETDEVERRQQQEYDEWEAGWSRHQGEKRARRRQEDDEDRKGGLGRRPAPALRRLLASTLGRLASVEARAVRRAAQRPGKFLAWMDEFYPGHESRLASALAPVLPACGVSAGAADARALAWCDASREGLLAAADHTPAAFPAAVEALLAAWAGRPETEAANTLGGDHAPNDAD